MVFFDHQFLQYLAPEMNVQSYVSLRPLPLPTCKRPSCSGSWPSCTCCILEANRTSWRWNIPHTLLCHSQSVTNRIKINLLHLPICTLCVPWWLGEETNRPPSVHERQRSWPQHWRPKPPRSLEASKRWARGRCQFFLQQTELLHPVRAESMRQFTSFQIHFYRPPWLQNSAPNPKKKVLSVLKKGTLAEMMSNYQTFWTRILRMTSWDCKKTKVLLRKACDWIPVNSKDIQRSSPTVENYGKLRLVCLNSLKLLWSRCTWTQHLICMLNHVATTASFIFVHMSHVCIHILYLFVT